MCAWARAPHHTYTSFLNVPSLITNIDGGQKCIKLRLRYILHQTVVEYDRQERSKLQFTRHLVVDSQSCSRWSPQQRKVKWKNPTEGTVGGSPGVFDKVFVKIITSEESHQISTCSKTSCHHFPMYEESILSTLVLLKKCSIHYFS